MDEFRRRLAALGRIYQVFLALSVLTLASMLWWGFQQEWTNAALQGAVAVFIGWRPVHLLIKPEN
ncbi:hypothetical protein [Haloechinothrix halophila]|uniref:hypothetical protein n=1 Tax=Haloechinothrix halophila TaxID=1069073 RepID=UPI0012FC96E1|nr:hypothetical protein [Haloechinothrix halophila]